MTLSKTFKTDGQKREYSNSENYDYHKINTYNSAGNKSIADYFRSSRQKTQMGTKAVSIWNIFNRTNTKA
jgi:hypothetical protein